MKKLNIGYIRVSTAVQVEKGHSLEAQTKHIRDYAKIEEIDNIKIYEDKGYSAGSTNRPRYKQLVELIKTGQVENLVIYKIDRISRNVIDFNNLINLCIDNEVNLISIVDGINLNTYMGKCIANIIMSIAQMEMEQISARTKQGILGGLEKGLYTFGGPLPLGIERTKENKLKYNDDIKIVKEMFKLDKKGYSYTCIEEKIKDNYDRDFGKSSIETILKNTLYRGYKIYEDKKYYFLKPIVEDTTNIGFKNKRAVVSERKRNIRKHTYIFEKFLGTEFLVTTAKRTKKTGEIIYYPYYISKENRELKLSENKILDLIIKLREKITIKREQQNNEYYERVKKLYILGHITEKEIEKYEKFVNKNSNKIEILEMIKTLYIDILGNLKIRFKDFGKEYNIKIV